MFRWFVVTVVLLLSAEAAATSTFEGVLGKFPEVALPFIMGKVIQPSAKLTARDVDALGFMRDGSDALRALRGWKQGKPKALWPLARVTRGTAVVLLVRCEDCSGPAMKETFLLSYDGSGQLQGGLTFHLETAGADGASTNVSSLNQFGVVSRVSRAIIPMHDEGLPPEMVVTGEQRAKVTATGGLEVMAPSYFTRSGTYLGAQSKEELRVFDKRVFYRGDETQPFQELEGDGHTMRLKGATAPYVLTWDERRSAISCQTPQGAVQLFARAR